MEDIIPGTILVIQISKHIIKQTVITHYTTKTSQYSSELPILKVEDWMAGTRQRVKN